MRSFISFLGAVLVVFLLFPGTNGAPRLVLTEAIINKICGTGNTRYPDFCRNLMTSNGFTEGKSLETPFETVALVLIDEAEHKRNDVHATGMDLSRRVNHQLQVKYRECLSKLDDVQQKLETAKEKAEEGMRRPTQANIKSAFELLENLNRLELSPSDEVHEGIVEIKDILSMIISTCIHMPHPTHHRVV